MFDTVQLHTTMRSSATLPLKNTQQSIAACAADTYRYTQFDHGTESAAIINLITIVASVTEPPGPKGLAPE